MRCHARLAPACGWVFRTARVRMAFERGIGGACSLLTLAETANRILDGEALGAPNPRWCRNTHPSLTGLSSVRQVFLTAALRRGAHHPRPRARDRAVRPRVPAAAPRPAERSGSRPRPQCSGERCVLACANVHVRVAPRRPRLEALGRAWHRPPKNKPASLSAGHVRPPLSPLSQAVGYGAASKLLAAFAEAKGGRKK